MKTIRRNSLKKLEMIIKNATQVRTMTLSNNFEGSIDTDPVAMRSVFNDIMTRCNSIYMSKPGIVVFHVHSNYWVEITTTAEV